MSWAGELREAFERLQAGQEPQVGFAGQPDRVGEVGRAFNGLARDLAAAPDGLTRAQAHALRNRLAGILSALYLLRDSVELAEEDRAALDDIVAEARALEARLRPRPSE